MFNILLLSWRLGIVLKLKVLLNFIFVRSVLKAGFVMLRPSRIVCVMCVRNVCRLVGSETALGVRV